MNGAEIVKKTDAHAFLPFAQYAGEVSIWGQLFYAAVIVAVVMALAAVLSRGVDRLQDKGKVPGYLLLPLRVFIKWGIFVLALLLILHNIGVQIGGIWALISTVLAMIAIGFVAVWSLLSNLSATLLILIFRPFEIGDTIEFVGEPTKGKVSRLSMMYTTLEESGGSVIQIPNNLIFQKVIRRKRGAGTEELVESLRKDSPPEQRIDPESAGAAPGSDSGNSS